MKPRILSTVFLSVALVAPPAVAGDTKPGNGLPGVVGGHAVVTPMPSQPEDSAGGEKADGRGMTFQAGDFEVTVTGSVSVEIGVGERPEGLRR
ncbi:MAG TPA: hypothetical protein GX405_19640 [Rhizobiales bacterium]|nr:hypothetical protein [Hyphomicrobiales bacterium]